MSPGGPELLLLVLWTLCFWYCLLVKSVSGSPNSPTGASQSSLGVISHFSAANSPLFVLSVFCWSSECNSVSEHTLIVVGFTKVYRVTPSGHGFLLIVLFLL